MNHKKSALFGALAIGLVSFCLAVLLGGIPSDAVSSKYKALISAGVIDAVVEPSRFGLEYLSQEPAESLPADQTTAERNGYLLGYIRDAEQKFAVMPEDMSIGIPLGTNYPISIGSVRQNSTSAPKPFENPIAVGVVNPNGEPQNITPAACRGMLSMSLQNGGNLPVPSKDESTTTSNFTFSSNSPENILLASESDSIQVSRRVPVIDLIVSRTQDRRKYLVPNVSANSFLRDVINAAVTNNIRRVPSVRVNNKV